MSLSVVILSRDAGNLVPCVNSIQRNDPDVPIIVVDDGAQANVTHDLPVRWVEGKKPFLPTSRMPWLVTLWNELKAQAPRYAKLLPDLPRLLADYLRRPEPAATRELQALLAEQRRTNRLLQALAFGGLGFALGLFVMLVFVRIAWI